MLHRDWCSAGYDPDSFWRQTPRSYTSAMGGALDRLRRDGERDLALAHTVASFTRAKKLEPLERYLPARPKTRRGGDMLTALKSIAAATAELR